jgi:aryl-alcohol dehydrogenase-like predicted oxidoreductase
MFSRREFLGTTLGAGAALAFTPEWLRAFEQAMSQLPQRVIPSSGEKLPIIGLGRGSRPVDPAVLKEVIKNLIDNGGKLVDASHGGPNAEIATGAAANELGIQNKIFLTTMLPRGGDRAAVKARIEASLANYKAQKIDLVQLGVISDDMDVPMHLSVLNEMKKEGRIRYIGITDLLPPPGMNIPLAPRLEKVMRNEPIDVVGFDYSVGDRRAEETLLPLAQERKIAVLAYFTFDRGRIFRRAGATPVPEWAAEFGAKTWPEFCLKYVLSHPAVTMARTGTSNPAHMLENIGAGIGKLPDEATRKKMAALVDTFPPNPR